MNRDLTTDPEGTIRLRIEELDWLPVDEDVVALDRRRDVYLATNHSGAQLWKALSAGATRTELVDMLVQSFHIDSDRATKDVEAYLEALALNGLIDLT